MLVSEILRCFWVSSSYDRGYFFPAYGTESVEEGWGQLNSNPVHLQYLVNIPPVPVSGIQCYLSWKLISSDV